MDALIHAQAEADRSYITCKASVGQAAASDILASGPSGLQHRPNLGQHRQQYDAFRSHAYTAISAIAKRIASRQLFVARVTSKPSLSRAKSQWLKNILPDGLKGLGDSLEPLETHLLLNVMESPNPVMVRWVLSYVTICSLELTGKAYLWMRDNGERIELWPLPSHWVEPDHTEGLFSGWNVKPDGFVESFHLEGNEIAYISLPDPKNPIHGSLSPLQSQAKAINTDDSLQTTQQQAFANGMFPTHVLTVGKDANGVRPRLTDSQRRQIINAVKKRYGGVVNAGEPLILDGLIESVDRLSRIPMEMDFLRSGTQVRSRIMQAFGVNPLIVGEIEGANRAQAVVAEQSFCSNVVNPLLDLLGQVFTAKIAPNFATENEKLVVWFEPAQAADEELRLKKWEAGLKSGVITGNEYRVHLLNLPERDEFNEPVAPGNQQDKQLAEAARGMEAALTEMKRPPFHPALPDAIVKRIRNTTANGNGQPINRS